MVKAAERTRTVDIVCDYFRIFYSALVGEGRRPFSKQRRIVINGPPEIITLGDIPDQAPIFHVNAPRQFVRDKRIEPSEPPRFYFVGLFIQTSTKLPSPSSLNRTPFIVPSAWTCARATPSPDIQRNSVRSGFDFSARPFQIAALRSITHNSSTVPPTLMVRRPIMP